MRVADFVFKYLADYGVKHVFLVVGGGSMFLNNSLRCEKQIKPIFQHHEQACAIAAEGYSRVTGSLSVVNVTTGPGSTNTITGVLGQWTDSVPVLYISGQVKFETSIKSCENISLRQLGDQEASIIDIVAPITKYATMITDANKIKYELEKAIYIATSGRPGPVWIDIPLNIQNAIINEDNLLGYNHFEVTTNLLFEKNFDIKSLLLKYKKPLLIAGNGIRISKAKDEFFELVNKLNIPVVTTFNGFDLIPSDHPNFIGRIGTIGTRAGNFALQNADLIISLGSRNNIRQTSYDWNSFAKNAYKIIVDIDNEELKKPTVKPDIGICDDVKNFIKTCLNELSFEIPSYGEWLVQCQNWKKLYPVVLEEYKKNRDVNPYYFMNILTECLCEGDIVVAGNGTACVTLFQAGNVKHNQRIFWNSGCASMGYDLPASIGACFASNKQVVCIAGDGSIMMNLQELQTISHYNLPIKIFILNNDGYKSIMQTQENYFSDNFFGCNPQSGITFPDFRKVAYAFNFKYEYVSYTYYVRECIEDTLSRSGPIICEVYLDPKYIFQPKLLSKKLPDGTIVSPSLENMFPFLNE